jgi:hypothetical protein
MTSRLQTEPAMWPKKSTAVASFAHLFIFFTTSYTSSVAFTSRSFTQLLAAEYRGRDRSAFPWCKSAGVVLQGVISTLSWDYMSDTEMFRKFLGAATYMLLLGI